MVVSMFLIISMLVSSGAAAEPVDLAPGWIYAGGSAPAVEPIVVGDLVIVALEGRTVVALDSRTGEVNWAAVANEEAAGSMLVRNELLFVPGTDGTLMVFSLATGSLETIKILGNSPLLELLHVGDTLVVGSQDGTIFILEADSLEVRSTLVTDTEITDAIAWENYAVFASQDGLVTGLDVGTADMVWQTNTADSPGSLTVVDQNILLGTNVGDVFMLDPADGSVEWMQTHGTMGIMDFAFADTGVMGLTISGDLLALDPATGDLRWQGVLTSGGYFASDVCGPNCLIMLTDGTFTAVFPLEQRIEKMGEVIQRFEVRPVSNDDLVVFITLKGDVVAWSLPTH